MGLFCLTQANLRIAGPMWASNRKELGAPGGQRSLRPRHGASALAFATISAFASLVALARFSVAKVRQLPTAQCG